MPPTPPGVSRWASSSMLIDLTRLSLGALSTGLVMEAPFSALARGIVESWGAPPLPAGGRMRRRPSRLHDPSRESAERSLHDQTCGKRTQAQPGQVDEHA